MGYEAGVAARKANRDNTANVVTDPPQHPPGWDFPTDDELSELEGLGREGSWSLGGTEVRLTNLDKVLFPGRDGGPDTTKRDLVRHAASIAPFALPYLYDRPVNLNRFPDGVDAAGFWHKAVPSHAPDWLSRWHHEGASAGDTAWYFVVDTPAAMVWIISTTLG